MKYFLSLSLLFFSLTASSTNSSVNLSTVVNDLDNKINKYTIDKGLYDNSNLILLRELISKNLSNPNIEIDKRWIYKIIDYGKKFQPFDNPYSNNPSISNNLEVDLIKYVLSRKDVRLEPAMIEEIIKIPFRPHIQDALIKYVFSRSDTPLQGRWFKHYIPNDAKFYKTILSYPHFSNFIEPAMKELGILKSKYNVKFLIMAMELPIFDDLIKKSPNDNKTCLNTIINFYI